MSLRLVRRVLFVSALATLCPGINATLQSAESRTELSITTFNIKYFGLDGDHDGEPGDDYRANTIIAHLNKYNLWSDVNIFQEIVDVPALQSLMGTDYLCHSYDNEDPRHQHVVICHKKKYTFIVASDDDNYALEDVAMERYRPAVHGILKARNGDRLLHVFGVHLKAQPNQSDIREQQTNVIADYLASRQDLEPVVIAGDFNTFNSDSDMMTQIYQRDAVDMKQVDNTNQFTYRSGSKGSKLDRFWISNTLKVTQNPTVSGPCNSVRGNNSDVSQYNKQVSDHCPVTIKVQVN